MIQFIRRFFGSKLGLGITLAFLVLIALAFASSDVAGTGTFGGVTGADRVAVVGDKRISTSDLRRGATQALDQVRQRDPTMTMPVFAAQGGLDEVLDQLIDQAAIAGYAQKYGLRAGKNLVNSEIMSIEAFRGPDGNFSSDAYRAALAQQGLNDAAVRRDLASGLLARQLLAPATDAIKMPTKIAARYAALFKERRKGTIAVIPSAVFAPKAAPTKEQLEAYYKANRSRYVRPERRTFRYTSFGIESLKQNIEPSEDEIAARYKQDADKYAANEKRTLTQFIVPTEDAAKAVRKAVEAGKSLENAAREAGFRTSKVGPVTRKELTESASDAVAQAVFAAGSGKIAEPKRSDLGWYVARIDKIDRIPARSLASATPEIAKQLSEEKREAGFADLSARIEEEIDGGAALSQVAAELGVKVATSPPLTADGRVYGTPTGTAPPELATALSTGFQMEEGAPQLAELTRGKRYLIFEVAEVTPSASAPLEEIKDDVTAQWRLAQGAKKAQALADKLLGEIKQGTTLAAAIRKEKVALPPVQSIDLTRAELAQRTKGKVPAPLALLFSMAKGTAKKLEGPSDIGWFIIDLKDASVDPVKPDDPAIAAIGQQLAQVLGAEYSDQMRRAMLEELGSQRNQAAIVAVRKQLTGENN